MNQEFIPYEQALALKELGFDEPCFAFWSDIEDNKFTGNYTIRIGLESIENKIQGIRYKGFLSAPTYSQAFRWFREKYDWQHSIDPTADQHSHKLGYNYWIWNYKTGEEHYTMPKNRPTGDWEYETYEEAELECLKKLIEIVKQ